MLRRTELLTGGQATAQERFRLFSDILQGFGLPKAAAREVCPTVNSHGQQCSYVETS